MNPDPQQLEKWQHKFGFDLISWIPMPRPLSFAFYSSWINDQKHADMEYLKVQGPIRSDPRHLFPEGKSLLVVAIRYKPHPEKISDFPQALHVASYAHGLDYHDWIHERLSLFCAELSREIPDFKYLIATDSKPLLERDLAYQAGLGWVGKNTCLIHPEEGSFFFLAEVLTNLDITTPALEPIPDFCGKCRKCMDACPTGAIESPKVLNANRCISYWTIEAKIPAPEPIRSQIGDLFFGCDICQEVCPWNEKVFRKKPLPEQTPRNQETLIEELRFFLTASNREMERTWGHTPLIRARPRGLRRNALIVAGNLKLQELKSQIESWTQDQELGELASWALNKINPVPVS